MVTQNDNEPISSNVDLKKKLKEPSFMEVVILFGLISMFGDILYEGARGILSPFLDTLNVSAVLVGGLLGLAEFIGFITRVISGSLTDRWRRYWTFIFIGYALLISLPLMALTRQWYFIIILYAMERIGKAIYAPAEDAVFSSIAKGTLGKAFGYRELLDQTGALIGPLVIAIILFFYPNDFTLAFGYLIIPFIIIFIIVYLVFRRLGEYSQYKIQEDIKQHLENNSETTTNLPSKFFIYGISVFFNALGLIYIFIFLLVATHVVGTDNIWMVGLFYAIIMVVQALSSPILGSLYDRYGTAIAFIPLVVAVIPAIFVVNASILSITIGCLFFGIVLSGQDSIFKAIIGDMVPYKRGTAFGYFYFFLSIGLLFSGVIFGIFVENNLNIWAPVFSIICEGLALIFLLISLRAK
ncbi:MAG: MFS transporter [Candidatus Thorarchaeota archaeon]